MGRLNRAIKAGKTVRVLFQAVTKAEVRFSPFDKAGVSAREFLKRAHAARRDNPGLEVVADVRAERVQCTPPAVTIEYAGGHRQELNTAQMTIRDITEEMERHARWKLSGSINPFAGGQNPLLKRAH
eukprot:Plantae.Rhodophyta-Rhodochaete_pulchella.ctg22704.p1 GENE.Plantae.Rhodophyta-Rhodochaete_pulchella.ctg22704~~Plantae.Rhodophyta-Rhodochaete_pulchella.ctg22704.p1  ORF type:complete len:127 (-),score=17.65 Plantae.Rhodophyta-Rhodochaete_pulchella.ctg22704:23-403(-)